MRIQNSEFILLRIKLPTLLFEPSPPLFELWRTRRRTGEPEGKRGNELPEELQGHPVNGYLIPGRRRGCSPAKALDFAERLRSSASLFAGEHKLVTAAIPSCEEQSISFETAGEQVFISRMNRISFKIR